MAATIRQSWPTKTASPIAKEQPSKNIITLEAWEALAPLNADDAASVATLKTACENRPLPLKVYSHKKAGLQLILSHSFRSQLRLVVQEQLHPYHTDRQPI